MIRSGFRTRAWWERVDWFLLLLIITICVIGLYNLESASGIAVPSMLRNQLLFFTFGGVIAIVIALLDTRVFESLSYPLYVVVNVLLIAVLVFGKEINGARRWIDLGVTIQPSEFAKISSMLAVSHFLAEQNRSDGFGFVDLLKVSAWIGPAFFFVFLEPDLGTSIVLLLISLTIVILSGVRGEALFAYAATVLLAVPVLWEVGLIRGYQKTRVLTFLRLPGEIALLELYGGILLSFLAIAAFLFGVRAYRQARSGLMACVFLAIICSVGAAICFDAFYEARATSINSEGPAEERARKLREIKEEYQPRQSEIAIGAGGLWGKGYKQGSQTQLRFLPIAWTDYIFSVFCEEHGFVGALFLLALYLAVIFWGFRLSRSAKDRFSAYIAVGCSAYFFWHLVVNIAMVTRLLPVVGVTLPLFSSGGSSLTMTLVVVGLLFNVSLRRTMGLR